MHEKLWFWGVAAGWLVVLYAIDAPWPVTATMIAFFGLFLLIEWHAARDQAKAKREFDQFVADVAARKRREP